MGVRYLSILFKIFPVYLAILCMAASPIAFSSNVLAEDEKCEKAASPTEEQRKQENLFWKTAVGSDHIDDYNNYIEAYPCGAFVSLAKTMIDDLKYKIPSNLRDDGKIHTYGNPFTDAQSSFGARIEDDEEETRSKKALRDYEHVLEIQTLLYNLNFDFGALDGKYGPKTAKAIRLAQEKLDLEQTGEVSEFLIYALSRLNQPTSWVSIAFNSRGGVGVSKGETSRAASEAAAKRRCKGRCKVATHASGGCVAIYKYSRRRHLTKTKYRDHWGAVSAFGADREAAKTEARNGCISSRHGSAKRCKFVTAACS